MKYMTQFWKNESGNVLMITGLSFLFLVGVGGAAYDLGKQQLVKQRIQQAADSAAIAAASMHSNGVTDANRESMARNMFTLNYPDSYLGVSRPPVDVVVNAPANVEVKATTTVQTSFVGNLGITSLEANGRSLAQIKRDPMPLDVILVMDNSGSMSLRDVGLPTLPPELVEHNLECSTRRTTLDFMQYIANLCADRWVTWGHPSYDACFTLRTSNYCPSRFDIGTNRMNAMRHAAHELANQLLNPNPLNNRIAIVNWNHMLESAYDFDSAYASVRSRLLGMYWYGGTNSTVGLQQADVYAAGFRGNAMHAVILLTDGANNSMSTQNPVSLAICTTLKARPNTLVFTIAFGPVVDDATFGATVRQFLSDCATGPNGTGNPKPNENLFFFPASDSAALAAAFDSIIGTLRRVQVLQ